MLDHLSDYYLKKEEPQKSCLLALRSIILEQDKNISETLKYGMPCFCYAKKTFCYLWIDNKTNEPYILLVDGKLLPYPELEQGKRSRMKILRIDPHKDFSIKTIKVIVNAAIDLCKTKLQNKKP